MNKNLFKDVVGILGTIFSVVSTFISALLIRLSVIVFMIMSLLKIMAMIFADTQGDFIHKIIIELNSIPWVAMPNTFSVIVTPILMFISGLFLVFIFGVLSILFASLLDD